MQAHRLSKKGVGHFPRKMDLIMNFREKLKKTAPHHPQKNLKKKKEKKEKKKQKQKQKHSMKNTRKTTTNKAS